MVTTGVYVGNSPVDFQAFENWFGSDVPMVGLATGRASWADWQGSISWLANMWKTVDVDVRWSIPMFANGGNLVSAAAGAYDTYYTNAAKSLLAAYSSESQIIVRVGEEFNGNWMPWSAQGDPQSFVAAYQHFVDAFRSVSDKFVFEWNVNVGDFGMDPASAYPGDKYVDIIGADFYYFKTWQSKDPAIAWTNTVNQKYGLQWLVDFAAAHNKPTAYSEWGVQSNDDSAYIDQAAKWFASHNTAYQIYWNSNADFAGKLSNNQYPATSAAYLRDFGLPSTPALSSINANGHQVVAAQSNANQLTLNGTASSGGQVQIFDGTKLIGTVTADVNGAWSFATGALTDGDHSFSSRAVNLVGNASAASGALLVTVDTVAPTAPKIVSNVVGANNTTVLSGTAEVGSKIAVYEGSTLLGTGVADAQGKWSVQTSALTVGAHHFVATATDAAGNVSQLSSTFDPVIGTVIESAGSVNLVQVGKNYYLSSGGTDLVLKYGGVVFVDGQFGAWKPLGVEKTASGYDVAWKNSSSGLYTVWSVDKNGNWASDLLSNVSGSSAAFKAIETLLNQDLNGDGTIGAPVAQSGGTATTKMIESIGDTSLSQVGSNFLLTPASGAAALQLKYGGAIFVDGQFGAWKPLGVETTATGYDVAWKNSSTGLYTVWGVDKTGNWSSDLLSNVSGSSASFKAMETLFHQDLNGDGVINTASTVIDVSGKLALDLGNMSQAATIAAGASLELTGAVSGAITFKAVTGTLILDKSAQFTGKIYGLSGDGNPNSSDILDLRDIAYGAGTKVSFSGDTSGGVLTVTDAQNHTAHLTLVGDYTHSTFNLSSDGAGGTLVIDPPMSGFNFAPAPAAVSAPTPLAQHDSYTGEGTFPVHATAGMQPIVDDHHVLPDQATIAQDAHIHDLHHFIIK